MPSSTSSSSQRLPHLAWWRILLGALLILAAFVAAMEVRLAARGFRPSVIDSEALWLQQRERASALGSHALILVGASRMQLDMDLHVLQRETGLEPVQLAIDGSPFTPILAGLARDPTIRGTVLVEFEDNVVADPDLNDQVSGWETQYERQQHQHRVPDFAMSEAYLTDFLHGMLRSYADGTRPITALLQRILNPQPTPQYLTMLPDRSMLADYSRISIPAIYYGRAIRNLGETVNIAPDTTYAQLDAMLKKRIAALKPVDDTAYRRDSREIAAMADAIKAHGGRVIFIVFPRSGDVKDMDERRYPRKEFWDRFAAATTAPVLNFEDVPALRGFTCPDGSHLDYRDRPRFTRALVAALGLGKNAGAKSKP